MKKASKTSVKLFFNITFIFSVLLIGALFIQSLYYKMNYTIVKKQSALTVYSNLSKDLGNSELNTQDTLSVLEKYSLQFAMESAVLNKQGQVLYYNYSPLLEEGISLYTENILPSHIKSYAGGQPIFADEIYLLSDGMRYNIIASNILSGGEVLLALSPVSLNAATPGILENYFFYILIISIIVCAVAAYMLSQVYVKEKELEMYRKEFLANASHELKTPISIIKGYSEALKDKIMEDKKDHYINQIALQADHMDKLVKDMLDLSDMERATYSINRSEFDICVLAEDIIKEYSIIADRNNLKINLENSFHKLIIDADRLKIKQVLYNFLDNAIHHSYENGEITLAIKKSDNNEVKISIRNKGDGICEDSIKKIWQRFYKNDNHAKKPKGTGLGLAIASKILELHNMKYGAENTDDGVEFYFLITPW